MIMPEPTLSKAETGYQDQPRGKERCGVCSMYRSPNRCTLVRGFILAQGWCKKWEAKK
jgi:23S rRNA C2498 (ribose-2'-O)-methylase RlmM